LCSVFKLLSCSVTFSEWKISDTVLQSSTFLYSKINSYTSHIYDEAIIRSSTITLKYAGNINLVTVPCNTWIWTYFYILSFMYKFYFILFYSAILLITYREIPILIENHHGYRICHISISHHVESTLVT
jgi:hypothetical protein